MDCIYKSYVAADEKGGIALCLETAEWGNVCSRVDTCALTGAAAFFTGIKGAEVLVNGPLWCYFYALQPP